MFGENEFIDRDYSPGFEEQVNKSLADAFNDIAEDNQQSSPNAIQSLFRKWTGSGQTGADLQAQNYQTQMANTTHQRAVDDMQKAGLNVALMYQNGSSGSPAPSAVSSGSGMGFQELVSALLLPMQLKQMQAQVELTKAQTKDTIASAENKGIEKEQRSFDLQFNKEMASLRKEAQERSNRISAAQEKSIYKQIDVFDAQIQQIIAATENEYEKKNLIIWQTAVQEATAKQIEELRPLQAMLLKAQTAAQKAAAAASYANAAYQNGLLKSGQIELMCENLRAQIRQAGSQADSAKADAFIKQYQLAIKTGNIDEFINSYEAEYGFSVGGRDFGEAVFAALNLVSSTIGNVFPKL